MPVCVDLVSVGQESTHSANGQTDAFSIAGVTDLLLKVCAQRPEARRAAHVLRELRTPAARRWMWQCRQLADSCGRCVGHHSEEIRLAAERTGLKTVRQDVSQVKVEGISTAAELGKGGCRGISLLVGQ